RYGACFFRPAAPENGTGGRPDDVRPPNPDASGIGRPTRPVRNPRQIAILTPTTRGQDEEPVTAPVEDSPRGLGQDSDMLLRTEQLTKAYGRFRALDRLDLTVAPGEVFGLLGPNGSGKSTALRLLLGFLRPTAGRASINGHDCWHESVIARRHVAYLPG